MHGTEIQQRISQLPPRSLCSFQRDRLCTVCIHDRSVQGASRELCTGYLERHQEGTEFHLSGPVISESSNS